MAYGEETGKFGTKAVALSLQPDGGRVTHTRTRLQPPQLGGGRALVTCAAVAAGDENGDAPEAGLLELRVDALHVPAIMSHFFYGGRRRGAHTRATASPRRRRKTRRKDRELRLCCPRRSSTVKRALAPHATRPCLRGVAKMLHYHSAGAAGRALQHHVEMLAPRLMMYLMTHGRLIHKSGFGC